MQAALGRLPTSPAPIAALVGLVTALALATMAPRPASEMPATAPGSGVLPLSFTPNHGQWESPVRFAAQGPGYAFHFTRERAVLSFMKGKRGVALHLTPLAANPDVRLEAGDRRAGMVNYLSGGERHTNLPAYGTLAYRELWPGIDLVFRGSEGTLKYEFHVRPGADPSRIRLAYRGADGLSVGTAGNLLIDTPLGTLRDSRPRSYQLTQERRSPVGSRYVLRGSRGYGFALGPSYDPGRTLVIDPGLTYSTYLAGIGYDQANGIAVDASGNAYVAGLTYSPDFPTTPGAFDTTYNANADAFVTKVNAAGSAFSYSTYLGGANDDVAHDVAVDSSGNAYVTGSAGSGFPTTPGAFDSTASELEQAFVTKLDTSGSALYSTALGGSPNDEGESIAVDGAGHAYVTGFTVSSAFPTTPGAFQTFAGRGDAFVTKLNATGSALVYSTYLGGAAHAERGTSIGVGAGGEAYIAGRTRSSDFPTTPGAYDTSFNVIPGEAPPNDAFAAKLNASGSALEYSTVVGGTGNEPLVSGAVDSAGNVYLAGQTSSSGYPTTAGAFDPIDDNPYAHAFVTKLNTTGSALVYSTFLGGSGGQAVRGVAVDAGGNAFVTGDTTSADYPVSAGAFDESHNGSVHGSHDAIVSRLNASGSALTYSTFLGSAHDDSGRAIAVDGSANAYVTGDTVGIFPTTPGAADTTLDGENETFVSKLNMSPTPGYVRPAGASPVRVSLVPAFVACTAPNRVHGSPDLTGDTNPDGSCNPPAQESSFVTVGEPTANAKPVRSVGFVRAKVIAGNTSTTVDEADVELSASISDIRDAGSLTDYTGELLAALELRITDRYNGATKNDPATGQVTTFPLKLTCTPTGGAQDAGSNCAATTTADAITPGAVREGVRSVWELGQVAVSDGGADGDADTTPNMVFARQGVFIP